MPGCWSCENHGVAPTENPVRACPLPPLHIQWARSISSVCVQGCARACVLESSPREGGLRKVQQHRPRLSVCKPDLAKTDLLQGGSASRSLTGKHRVAVCTKLLYEASTGRLCKSAKGLLTFGSWAECAQSCVVTDAHLAAAHAAAMHVKGPNGRRRPPLAGLQTKWKAWHVQVVTFPSCVQPRVEDDPSVWSHGVRALDEPCKTVPSAARFWQTYRRRNMLIYLARARLAATCCFSSHRLGLNGCLCNSLLPAFVNSKESQL